MKNNITILYDWDNTLVDTNPVCLMSLNKFFDKNNIKKEITHEDLRNINNMLFEDYLSSHFKEKIDDKLREYRDIYYQCADQLILLNHTMSFLSFFHNLKIKQGIISNKPSKVLIEEVKKLNVHQYEKILGGDSAKFPKPSNELMNLMKAEMKIENDTIIFVGDSKIDIDFAINANVPIIFVGNEKNIEEYKNYKKRIILAKSFDFNPKLILEYISKTFN